MKKNAPAATLQKRVIAFDFNEGGPERWGEFADELSAEGGISIDWALFSDFSWVDWDASLASADAIIVFGIRTEDLIICARANEYGKPVFIVQHGIEFFPGDRPALSALGGRMRIALTEGRHRFREFFGRFLFAIKHGRLVWRLQNPIEKEKIVVQSAAIFLPSHSEFQKFPNSLTGAKQIYVIRDRNANITQNPDSANFRLVYVVQPFLEKGEISEDQQKDILEWLEHQAKFLGRGLKIKLHPKSDHTLWCRYDSDQFVQTFYHNDIVIGHYSTLLPALAEAGLDTVLQIECCPNIPDVKISDQMISVIFKSNIYYDSMGTFKRELPSVSLSKASKAIRDTLL